MVRALLFACLVPFVTVASACERKREAPPEPARPRFAGADLFGTSRFTLDQVSAAVDAKLGDTFARYEAAWLARDYEGATPLKLELEKAVKELGGFAFVDFAVVQYFTEGQPSFLTIDVVEQDDAARRMAFLPRPPPSTKGDGAAFVDPGDLFATQAKYEAAGWELMRAGVKLKDDAAAKATFHSVFGFAHEKLAPFKEPLLEGAQLHADAIIAILHQDPDDQRRAAAAFLLAFTTDGDRVVKELASACKDPSSHVRNNALRVYAETARHHPEVVLPVDVVLDCLDFPGTTDRNKAAAILEPLSKKPELRETILRRGGPTLLAMLRLRQPNNRDYAWMILKNLSGEQFAASDVDAWQRWLDASR